MTVFPTDFPFDEIRKGPHDTVTNDGDYFDSVTEAMDITGLPENHIWCVMDNDGVITYGPSHHYVNRIGYIATHKPHDGDTYYEKVYETERYATLTLKVRLSTLVNVDADPAEQREAFVDAFNDLDDDIIIGTHPGAAELIDIGVWPYDS